MSYKYFCPKCKSEKIIKEDSDKQIIEESYSDILVRIVVIDLLLTTDFSE